MRDRAGIVLCCKHKNKILLIFRKKDGREYWVVPGGGVEKNETLGAVAKREIFEELGLSVTKMSDFCEINSERGREKYYLSYLPEDIPLEIQCEELKRNGLNNVYSPRWLSEEDLQKIELCPPQIKNALAVLLAKQAK